MISQLLIKKFLACEKWINSIDNNANISISNLSSIIFIMRRMFPSDSCGNLIDHSSSWLQIYPIVHSNKHCTHDKFCSYTRMRNICTETSSCNFCTYLILISMFTNLIIISIQFHLGVSFGDLSGCSRIDPKCWQIRHNIIFNFPQS